MYMVDFSILGLTGNESKVFDALIRKGKSSSSEVSRESGVSYSRIYDILGSLEHKGLVKVIPEKSKKFIASNPESLKQIILEKKKELENLDKEIDEMKNLYDLCEKDVIEVVQGKKNFYKLTREMPEPKENMYNVKYSSEYHLEWVREMKNSLKSGVHIKELVRNDEDTEKNVLKWLKINPEIKSIPNTGVAISSIDKKIMLISLIKSNVQLLIRDKAFIELIDELLLNYFENKNSL